MEAELTILTPFFEYPERRFYIRELSRILKINHTTVRQRLNKLVKGGFLVKEESNITSSYKIILSGNYIYLKLYYNLEKLRKSGIIGELQKQFDFPTIVIFGSYAKAMDDKGSDIDICVISDIKKNFDFSKHEKVLNRKVSIHHFTKKSWEESIKKNPHLINSICNGIVLSGELEVVK